MNINIPDNITINTFAGAIDVYEGIFTEETSLKIIESLESSSKNKLCPIIYNDAQVGQGFPGGSVRSNLTMSLFEHDNVDGLKCECSINEIIHFIKEKLSLYVRYYSEKYDVDIAFDEGLQVLKYEPGRQYKAHIDWGPGAEHRMLSGLIYLNPGHYIGGGTYFTNFDITINPDKPSLALFPSNYAYMHSARPVFDGYKYAIVTWFGPPNMRFP